MPHGQLNGGNTMRFKFAASLGASLALGAISLPVHAIDMLGDTLKFERVYPDVDTPIQITAFTTVAAGLADAVVAGDTYLLVNPEANAIEFDFQVRGNFLGDDSLFDGFRIGGFSHTINALSIAHVSGLTVVSLGLDASNRIVLNLAGLAAVGVTARRRLTLRRRRIDPASTAGWR